MFVPVGCSLRAERRVYTVLQPCVLYGCNGRLINGACGRGRRKAGSSLDLREGVAGSRVGGFMGGGVRAFLGSGRFGFFGGLFLCKSVRGSARCRA